MSICYDEWILPREISTWEFWKVSLCAYVAKSMTSHYPPLLPPPQETVYKGLCDCSILLNFYIFWKCYLAKMDIERYQRPSVLGFSHDLWHPTSVLKNSVRTQLGVVNSINLQVSCGKPKTHVCLMARTLGNSGLRDIWIIFDNFEKSHPRGL